MGNLLAGGDCDVAHREWVLAELRLMGWPHVETTLVVVSLAT